MNNYKSVVPQVSDKSRVHEAPESTLQQRGKSNKVLAQISTVDTPLINH